MEAATFYTCVNALLPVLFQLEAEVVVFGYSADMFAQCFDIFAHSRVPDRSLAWIRLYHSFKKAKVPRLQH
jgi:hypothetical protein